jgi:hypothetical protein
MILAWPAGLGIDKGHDSLIARAQLGLDRFPFLLGNRTDRSPDLIPVRVRPVRVRHGGDRVIEKEGDVLDLGGQRPAFAADRDRGSRRIDPGQGLEQGGAAVEVHPAGAIEGLAEQDF